MSILQIWVFQSFQVVVIQSLIFTMNLLQWVICNYYSICCYIEYSVNLVFNGQYLANQPFVWEKWFLAHRISNKMLAIQQSWTASSWKLVQQWLLYQIIDLLKWLCKNYYTQVFNRDFCVIRPFFSVTYCVLHTEFIIQRIQVHFT